MENLQLVKDLMKIMEKFDSYASDMGIEATYGEILYKFEYGFYNHELLKEDIDFMADYAKEINKAVKRLNDLLKKYPRFEITNFEEIRDKVN
jgi:hypothetical protein